MNNAWKAVRQRYKQSLTKNMKYKLFIAIIFMQIVKAGITEPVGYYYIDAEDRSLGGSVTSTINYYYSKLRLPENQAVMKKNILSQLQNSNIKLPKEMLDIIVDYTIAEYLDMNGDQILNNKDLINKLIDEPELLNNQKPNNNLVVDYCIIS